MLINGAPQQKDIYVKSLPIDTKDDHKLLKFINNVPAAPRGN